MMDLRFELRYNAKERKWYIYDEEGTYRYCNNINEIPEIIKANLADIKQSIEKLLIIP